VLHNPRREAGFFIIQVETEMFSRQRIFSQRPVLSAAVSELVVPSDGEINFLWSFIQGSIMIPETWNALLRSYGFCGRHAWIHLGVEISFRDEYLLGPTILYAALVDKALNVMRGRHSAIRRLRASGRCLLCALDVENAAANASPLARIERGRDGSALRSFARRLETMWSQWVCSECLAHNDRGPTRNSCRGHLIAAVKVRMAVDIVAQRSLLLDLSDGVARYRRSFSPGAPKASDRDRAALIAAIGWCSGWRPLLVQLT
jgi:hypothetical protein